MTGLTGLPVLLRLIARRERVRTPLAVVICVALLAVTGASVASLYADRAQRLVLQRQSQATPAFRLLLGPLDTIDPVAAVTSWRIGLFLMVVVGVIVALTVTRNLRAPEQAGQTELLRAGTVGRLAPLAAALIWAAGTAVLLAGGIGVVIVAFGGSAPAAGAVTIQYLIVGLGALGVAAVADEVMAGAREASLVTVGYLIGGYVLRGIGDMETQLSWLRWASPVGWASAVSPFDDRNLWPAALGVALAIVGVVAAVVVADRRDLGQGAFATRPGPDGSTALRSFPRFAVRDLARPMLPWVVGAGLYAVLLGTVLGSATTLMSSAGPLADIIKRVGGADTIVNSLIGAVLGIIAILAGVAAVVVVTRLRAAEASGRTELILATATSRRRHLLVSAAVAGVSASAILATAGLGITVGHILSPGSADVSVGAIMTRAVAQIPGTLVLAAVAVAAYANGMRWTPVAWAAVIADAMIGLLGAVLQLPRWLRDVAPHSHVRPDGTIGVVATTVLLAITVAVIAVATVLYARRDIPG